MRLTLRKAFKKSAQGSNFFPFMVDPVDKSCLPLSVSIPFDKGGENMGMLRHNLFLLQISHQYTLVDEQGPAHKKNFFVKLQLGEKEEYSASGPSIKKAQHAAAGIALEKTECKHPPPKVKRNYPGLFQIDLTNGNGLCIVFDYE